MKKVNLWIVFVIAMSLLMAACASVPNNVNLPNSRCADKYAQLVAGGGTVIQGVYHCLDANYQNTLNAQYGVIDDVSWAMLFRTDPKLNVKSCGSLQTPKRVTGRNDPKHYVAVYYMVNPDNSSLFGLLFLLINLQSKITAERTAFHNACADEFSVQWG